MTNISIVQGDITEAKVDVIVNAANPVMLGGGGVDGAIHHAAGPELLKACMNVEPVDGIRCPAGEARITSAGNLNADYVIHTVGPRYDIDVEPQNLLFAAYSNSLELVLENKCNSVAFPAISCGVYGYPLKEAAEIAIQVCQSEKYNAIDICFYLFGVKIVQIWRSVLFQTNA